MKKNGNRNLIFVVCYLSYMAIYIARLNLSMASPALKEAQLLSATQIGLLGSVFSIIYAIGRLVNGTFGDRQPPWVMICSGLFLAGISNLLIGFLPPFVGMLLFWSVNAFAQSMLWSSVLCVVTQLYDRETARAKTSVMVTSVASGNIVAILINLYLIEHFGVQWAFLVPGMLTLLFGAANLVLLRKMPVVEQPQKAHMNLLQLLKDGQIRTSIGSSMIHGVMKDNITLWMTVFFVDRFAVNLETSAYFVLFIPIIGFVGRTLYTPLYRLCGCEEHRISVYGFVVCAGCAVVLCLPWLSPVLAMVCLSLIYAAVSMINTSFLSIYPLRYLESGNVSSVSGVMDFSTYLGAGIASMCYGVVIEYFGYVPMFVSWAVLSVVGIGLARTLLRCIRAAEQKTVQ